MCQTLVCCTVGVVGIVVGRTRTVWKVTNVIFSGMVQESPTIEGDSPVGEKNYTFFTITQVTPVS